eukprot:GEMP01051370.1.p1 GENE.GEMP01051370.1~~GEMP01051370.1.p1  ORF type:complete len:301 (+),score=49.15 GEMP01051370.1:219-1121(+)
MRRGIVRLCNASLLPEKFVFVGGKGGVGKTTMAAAISTQLASQPGRTLVVSTDPAHSLSDAFRMPLSSTPTKLADIGQGELWGMEIDSRESLRDLEKALDIERIRRIVDSNEATLGHGVINFLQNQGVEVKGFVDLLNMSPPGIDETVALSQLMRSSATGEYKRVVVDTAPTGHTLRLLAFPKFLLSSMQGLLSFQDKMFKGLDTWNINFMKKIVGDGLLQQLKNSEAYLDKSKASMDILQTILLDPTKTRFVVVSIPTMLAVDETERLLTAHSTCSFLLRFPFDAKFLCPRVNDNSSEL